MKFSEWRMRAGVRAVGGCGRPVSCRARSTMEAAARRSRAVQPATASTGSPGATGWACRRGAWEPRRPRGTRRSRATELSRPSIDVMQLLGASGLAGEWRGSRAVPRGTAGAVRRSCRADRWKRPQRPELLRWLASKLEASRRPTRDLHGSRATALSRRSMEAAPAPWSYCAGLPASCVGARRPHAKRGAVDDQAGGGAAGAAAVAARSRSSCCSCNTRQRILPVADLGSDSASSKLAGTL